MIDRHRHIASRAARLPALRPLSAVALVTFASAVHAVTTINSSTETQTLSTDTSYVLGPGTQVSSTSGDGIIIQGIAPASFTNAGTVISAVQNQAAAIRFSVDGTLTNQATGQLLGNTSGVIFDGNGSANSVVNHGDISVRASWAITFGGSSGGTVDNFGTLDNGSAGPLNPTSGGVELLTSGNVTINNHAGAAIKSGTGDGTYGWGIDIEQGTATINNDGTISAYRTGIQNSSASAQTINNSSTGTIESAAGTGVVISTGSATITNDGAITGNGFGISVGSGATANISNSATGVIRGTVSGGVQLNQNDTLVNQGLIESTSGPAIELMSAGNAITLGTGSRLSGANGVAIHSYGGFNTITLTGTATENGAFAAAVGGGFTGLTAAAGSSWILNGSIVMGGTSAQALHVIGDLTIGGAVLDNASGITVDPGGTLTLGTGGATGSVTGNIVNNGTLRFNRSAIATFGGVITGTGALQQEGSGIMRLTAAGSSQNTVNVDTGTLALNQTGAFNAGTWTTASGATTSIAPTANLAVGSAFTQAQGSTLTVGIGNLQPIITAATANVAGALNVSGFGATAPNKASELTSTQFNVIRTTGGITGDFSSVQFSGAVPLDYLTPAGSKSADNFNYNLALGLTWLAGATKGNGVFTLANATDTFNVDVPLADQAAVPATGWDGRTLTKNGAGVLILSGANTYTGATAINDGIVQTGIANAIATSGNVSVASGATLDMNGFAQRLNNLSGAGAILLGNATLTAANTSDTAFSGTIAGAGGVTKTGGGALTLSGANAYAGGTSIDAGTLVAGNGNALGSGAIANNSALQLDFASDGVLANTLSGAGTLHKSGGGAAALAGIGSTQGSVSVDAGALRFLQAGAFTTTGDYTTAAGASTTMSGQSQLNVGNAFAMNGTLNSVVGTAEPVIGAKTATIGPNTTFNIAGYHADPSASASQLASNAFTEIHTTTPGGLSGTFANTRIGGTAASADYLTLTSAYTPQDYVVGIGLTWYASHGTTPQTANGVFTLTDAADSFDMDAILADQAANPATRWDGTTLTKAGAGTLRLSKANTFSGATLVNGGTLQAGAGDVIANSANVMIAPGATFDLNGFDQHANNVTGAGNVALSGATLTANYTADSTFDGVIGGNGNVVKTGANTLTLTGNNTFTGTTTIGGGTLQLGAGGTSGGVTGDIVDNGALVFNRSDNVTYGNTISGTGNLVQQGSGSLVLPNTQTYSGTTAVNAGALVLTNGAQLAKTSQVTVAPGATFGGYGGVGGSVTNNGLLAVADAAPGFANGPAGQFAIGGALVNGGEIRMSSPTPASTLTVGGNYTGNNGQLTLSTVLNGDGSPSDRLVVRGDTAGQTSVKVVNAGGAGAVTNNGIQIVRVDGQSNGAFSLNGRAIAGPYEYQLYKGGVSTPGDGGWYLRSASDSPPSPTPTPTPRPEPGGYLGNQAAARSMFVMTYHDRAGIPDPYTVDGMTGNESTAWVRTQGSHTDENAAGGRIDESADTAIVQAGIDLLHRVSNGQRWQAGVMAGYGSTTTDTSAQHNPNTSRGNVNGASAGAYATWHRNPSAPDGPYVDTWFQYAHFDNSVKGSFLNGESYKSNIFAGSVEGGWAIPVAMTSTGRVMVEPQVQLIYTNYGADDHVETNGTVVHSDSINALTTRLGVRIFHAPGTATAPGWQPFAELNWWHDTSGNSIAFNNVVLSQDGPKNRMEFKVGAQGQLGRQWRVWGNLGYQQGDGGYRSYEGLIGAKYIF